MDRLLLERFNEKRGIRSGIPERGEWRAGTNLDGRWHEASLVAQWPRVVLSRFERRDVGGSRTDNTYVQCRQTEEAVRCQLVDGTERPHLRCLGRRSAVPR